MPNSQPTSFDCTVKEVDGQAHIRWGTQGDQYRLTRLAKNGQPVTLPGEDELLNEERLLALDRAIIFGERSGGGEDFFDWVGDTLDKKDYPWVLAHGHGWKPDLIKISDKNPYTKDLRKTGSFLEALTQSPPSDGAQKLIKWAKSINSEDKLTILVRDLARLPEGKGTTAAQAIRIASEFSDTSEKIRFLLISTSEFEFEDTYISSGLAPMSDLFRLPWLNKKEVGELARTKTSGINLEPEALNKLIEVTGGQPLLVQALLARIPEQGQVSKKEISKEFRALRNSPPDIVSLWQDDLRSRIRADPALSDAVRNYIAGHSRSIVQGIPNSHIHLFYPGWIRFDREIQRWKISSRLHAEYAYSALAPPRQEGE